MKVQVVGLGTVGLPTAMNASKFLEVIGRDVDKVRQEVASKVIPVTESLVEADAYLIDVSTLADQNGNADMSAVYNVCDQVSETSPESLVSIESTVAVGTCRDIAKQFGLSNLVCCPHRFWPADPKRYGAVQMRLIGGLNKESLKSGRNLYNLLRIPVHTVTSLEVAEIAKVVENSFRFVQISFAESVALICKKKGLPFEEIRAACNTLRRKEHDYQVQVLEARRGIGGNCLPKDIRHLLDLDNSPILLGALKTDSNYRASLPK